MMEPANYIERTAQRKSTIMYASGPILAHGKKAARATVPQMTSTLTEVEIKSPKSDGGSGSKSDFNLSYVIPPDVRNRVIDIPNDFTGYDKRDFELTDEESEMVQAVLIANDEIKARCADMAKQIFDDYKGKKLTILGFH